MRVHRSIGPEDQSNFRHNVKYHTVYENTVLRLKTDCQKYDSNVVVGEQLEDELNKKVEEIETMKLIVEKYTDEMNDYDLKVRLMLTRCAENHLHQYKTIRNVCCTHEVIPCTLLVYR